MRAEHQTLAAVHATLTRELDQTRDALAQLQATYRDQGTRLATIEAENAGLRQRLADRVTEVETLDRQLSQTRIQFEHYQDATAAQRTEERQGYEQRIARLEQDLAGAQRHIAAQRTTLGQQETTVAHLTAEQARHEHALRDAQEELVVACLARDRLAGRFENETAAKGRAETRLDTAQQQLAEIRAELAGKTRESELLGEQLRRAEEQASHLADEKTAWLQERGALVHRVQAVEQRDAAPIDSTTSS